MNQWSRVPVEVVDSHPWKHSRSGWMGLWATWSCWRCPYSLQGMWNNRLAGLVLRCQRGTCSDSYVKHRTVNKREWFDLNKELRLSHRSNRWLFKTQISCVTARVRWRPHSQKVLQLKNRGPLWAHTKLPTLRVCQTSEFHFWWHNMPRQELIDT